MTDQFIHNTDYRLDPGAIGEAAAALTRLAAIMAHLRSPEGCAWDRAQDFASIAPYTLEEAYEVADAIARADMADLREELGDLALQVVYHAQMAAEAGAFTLADVLSGIADKMVRRHPHVFGDGDRAADLETQWDAIKAAEKSYADPGDVPLAFPALTRAQKVLKRAAKAGRQAPEPIDLATALSAPEADRHRLAGDALFGVAAQLRAAGIDAESALRDATARYARA